MARFEGLKPSGSGIVKTTAQLSAMKSLVLSKVTIPMYFYNIIIPQLPGYFDLYPVNFDNDPRACCPLHDEDTPSFRYYDETDSFYCFGCQRGGTVLNLHMYFAEKMNGTMPSKEDTIAFLYQYFIQGHESETFIDSSKKKIDTDVKLNTDSEIVKFNMYRTNLENAITYDTKLKLDSKELIWRELDKIDILLSKNLIKVDEAQEYLQKTVKENTNIDCFSKEYRKIEFNNTIPDMKYIRKK